MAKRSAYADMLHDTERNKLYYRALKKAVVKRRLQNEKVQVLDIGTGTGLLSMMAARLGANTVDACEAFTPMADCAKKIISANGFQDKIHLIPKRSTEVQVGEGQDMSQRANILITEVFDTELIGEGAISTFSHALDKLLQPGSSVVPAAANMFVQLVSSEFVRRWNQIQPITVPGSDPVTSPEEISSCGGAPSLHDLQLDQLPQSLFHKLTEPVQVFRFDFCGRGPLKFNNRSEIVVDSLASGKVDALFMWWELEMDEEGEIILSCAPRWAHPTPSNMQWRDHWMQAVYYPYTNLNVEKGQKVKIISSHDEYSLWFDVQSETSNEIGQEMRPICTCGAHVTYSRSRLGMLSDPQRLDTYREVISKHVKPDSICLCISDGSLLPLLLARMGASHVFTVEPEPMCHRLITTFIKHNGLENKVTVIHKRPENITTEDLKGHKIDIILAEPFFQSSLLPWDNMYYWYALEKLTNHRAPDSLVLPFAMTIKGVAVAYKDLWKIRAPVGNCEGFNLDEFDHLVEHTSDSVDANVEPQPLWEYPCIAVSQPETLLKADFTSPVSESSNITQQVQFLVKCADRYNGFALWADFHFGDDHVISTGPRRDIRLGQEVEWDYYSRQGVHLVKSPSSHSRSALTPDLEIHNKTSDLDILDKTSDLDILVHVDFKPSCGDVNFKFEKR